MYTEIKAKGMFDFIDTFWQLVQIYATLKIQWNTYWDTLFWPWIEKMIFSDSNSGSN